MKKLLPKSCMDEMLILCILKHENATITQIKNRILFLSNGKIDLNMQYIGNLMFRLRSMQFIKKSKEYGNDIEYELSETGINEVEEWSALYLQYDECMRLVSRIFPLPNI